jgi:hypothetical protein
VLFHVVESTHYPLTVTAEVASSSLVVPAIPLNGLQRTPKNNLGPFGSNKSFSASADQPVPPIPIIGETDATHRALAIRGMSPEMQRHRPGPRTETKNMMVENAKGGAWLPPSALEQKRNPLN